MKTVKRVFYFVGSLLCVGYLVGPGNQVFGADAPQRVRIAYASRSSSAMPLYMAQTKGFFKSEALDVEIIQMNPRLGATAVVNGDVSFATPFVSTFRAILQGFPMKVVFVHL
jgi:ABC-type nitrate/sulfonate/bicarbonate transport system substrate-binding protein